jgi:aspartyl/asparaginyl beta-hydroxylase (cupin superfamily)
MHSSYNYSNKDRIILIIDMERPKEIPKGKSKVAYKKEVLDFINSFYNKDDIESIKNELSL